MHRSNAFLLIELLIAFSIFTMCALGIAFTSTAILTSHYAILKQGKTLLVLQNNLEKSKVGATVIA
jgi:Tfp pilus assembly protein PilV